MAEYSTPKSTGDFSSVFMTPSSSAGRPVYRKPQVLTPVSHLTFPLSPATTPEMSDRRAAPDESEYTDILSSLRSSGVPLIVDQIVSMLSPKDLYSCLQVCHTWHDIISSKPQRIELIRSSHFQMENIKKQSLPLNSHSLSRRALSSISTNTLHPLSQVSLTPSPLSYKAESTQKHHPCPSCGSPARKLNLRRAVCTRPVCSLDFCQKCFRQWHEGECVTISSGVPRSPKRSQPSTLIAGSHKSKKRLRRL